VEAKNILPRRHEGTEKTQRLRVLFKAIAWQKKQNIMSKN
jgi:hypothetical protein